MRYGGIWVPTAFPAPIIVTVGDLSDVISGGLVSLAATTFVGLC